MSIEPLARAEGLQTQDSALPELGLADSVRLWQGTFLRDAGPVPGSDGRTDPTPTLVASTASFQTAANPRLAEIALLAVIAFQPDPKGAETPDAGVGMISTAGVASASVSANALPTATVQQLAVQLAQTLLHRSDGSTEIALSPDELGHVRVNLQTDPQNPDRLVVMLTFERPETLDLFRRHADQLAEALREAGYSGADIGFDHAGTSNGKSQPDAPAVDEQPAPPPELGPALAAEHPALRLSASGSLDLRL